MGWLEVCEHENGYLRLQAFGVTEPNTGSDTTQLKTVAVRTGDKYIVNGQKVFISRTEYSDLMILLFCTTPLDQVKKRTEGLSVLLDRSAGSRWRWDHDPPDSDHDEPRDHGAVYR